MPSGTPRDDGGPSDEMRAIREATPGGARAVAAALSAVLVIACAPLGSSSETVERPDYATGTPPLVLGDGTTEVLGISRAADPGRPVEPVPVTAEPLLPHATSAPPPTAPPPTAAHTRKDSARHHGRVAWLPL